MAAGNLILALQGLSVLLNAISQSAIAAQKINETIGRARSEGRDVTDEELAVIKAQTDALEQNVLAKLRAAAATPEPGTDEPENPA